MRAPDVRGGDPFPGLTPHGIVRSDCYSTARCEIGRTLKTDEWLVERKPKRLREVKRRRDPVELSRALDALRQIDEESIEEGYEPCPLATRMTAQRVVHGLYRAHPAEYDVYPTAEREIAITAANGKGRAVLVLIEPEGGASCFATLNGANRRARYSSADQIPDGFVLEALTELFAD